jgi:hypothetical protein
MLVQQPSQYSISKFQPRLLHHAGKMYGLTIIRFDHPGGQLLTCGFCVHFAVCTCHGWTFACLLGVPF